MREIVRFSVLGDEACPWSTPTITRWGGKFYRKSNPKTGKLNLPDWQAKVKAAATVAMLGIPVPLGPIKVCLEFRVVTPKGHRNGELWVVHVRWNEKAKKGEGGWVKDASRSRTEPDLRNLAKGVEDALENVVYVNDVQVRIAGEDICVYGPEPGVVVTVYAIEDGDYPGSGERA